MDIDYRHFEPRGAGWITLSTPEYMSRALAALDSQTLAAFPIRATPSLPPSSLPLRTRGPKGRMEAAERAVLTGDGPTAGVSGSGRNVVISGLPGRLSPDALRLLVKNFKLAGATPGEQEIAKIEL